MPGDRRPPKRKQRGERERIEYAPNGLAWLREHLEPVAQGLLPQPEAAEPARPRPAWLERNPGREPKWSATEVGSPAMRWRTARDRGVGDAPRSRLIRNRSRCQ